jgi:hypothetical protein
MRADQGRGSQGRGAGQSHEAVPRRHKQKAIAPVPSAPSSQTRSSSVPRQALKSSRSSSSQPSRGISATPSLPSSSPYGRAAVKTRQVNPFPSSQTNSRPHSALPSRPRSAPTRSSQRKGGQDSSPVHGVNQNRSRHALPPPPEQKKRNGPKGGRAKAPKKIAPTEEISLSLDSDYPVWK